MDKQVRYKELFERIRCVVGEETDLIANMANLSALIMEGFNFLWVGFYLVKGDELVLGPFQGAVACTRIRMGRGVCGDSWERGKTIIVDNVENYPGHIACNTKSRSEIVVPLLKDGKVFAVLDIDSEFIKSFDNIDSIYLEKILELI